MKKVLFLLIALPHLAYAQTESTNSYIYTGLSLYKASYSNESSQNAKTSFSPIIGYLSKDKRNNFNDFQVYNISYKKESDLQFQSIGSRVLALGSQITISSSANASYHKIFSLTKDLSSKLYVGIGVGILAYFEQQNITPQISTEFPSNKAIIGIANSIKPIFNYAVSNKLFIGFSPSVNTTDLYYVTNNVHNPSLGIKSQGYSKIETQVLKFSDLHVQLLMGLNLN